VPSGSVSLKAVATVDGQPVTVDQQIAHSAASCG
jgi:hypothetical protein